MKIYAKCVACSHKAIFGPDQRETPMCAKCFSPMYVTKVVGKIRGGKVKT